MCLYVGTYHICTSIYMVCEHTYGRNYHLISNYSGNNYLLFILKTKLKTKEKAACAENESSDDVTNINVELFQSLEITANVIITHVISNH